MTTENIEIEKVKSKVPKWFRYRQNQINSQILLSFLKLNELNNIVTIEMLEQECNLKTFKSNFQQMCNFSEKNNAKIFTKFETKICLWDKVEKFILDEYQKSKIL